MEEKDAVIVGARCAGATLAIELARRDWDVLLVDRRLPSLAWRVIGMGHELAAGLCLGPVPEAGSLGQALRVVGERAGRGAGRARHLQPSGRPVPRSEQGTPRALVRS
jgi:glycine/D-amino acid oxidase-like deaminating enzyme